MRDVRHLYFSRADVLKAVMYFRERNGITVPESRSVEIHFTEHDLTVDAVVALQDFGVEPTFLSIDSHELMATLLLYCFYKKVSLPNSGERRLSVVDDELVLTFSNVQ
ncbi:MAG: hypothetical protein WCF85_02225 [Rhodospirillaceae bacterium]